VFDAYKVAGKHREIEKVNDVYVVYTKEAETADAYIEKTTHQLSKNNRVEVASSDNLEQIIILGSGALRISADSFLKELKSAEKEIDEMINNFNQKK
jgi:predicted RNA-binding protein with PIN domain